MNLSIMNQLTSTIIACSNSGLDQERIALKLCDKFSIDRETALLLIGAVLRVAAEIA